MIRLLTLLVCTLILCGGCKSSDKKNLKQAKPTPSAPMQSGAAEQTTGIVDPEAKRAELCNTPPAPKMCCQALTPSCNQCRADNLEIQNEWRESCGGTELAQIDCNEGPPVFECCDENESACQQCREAAATALMQWKGQCADYVAHACDEKPPQEACCEALTPACEACSQRNLRVMNEWSARCDR